MKVQVKETVEVTDEQRRQIASVLAGKVVKRDAIRDDMKQYIWERGEDWEAALATEWAKVSGEEPESDDDEDEDLIGLSGDDDEDYDPEDLL